MLIQRSESSSEKEFSSLKQQSKSLILFVSAVPMTFMIERVHRMSKWTIVTSLCYINPTLQANEQEIQSVEKAGMDIAVQEQLSMNQPYLTNQTM
jgi:hypothetical protein